MKRHDHYKPSKPPLRQTTSITKVTSSGKVKVIASRICRTGTTKGNSIVILRTNDQGFIGCETLQDAIDMVTEFGFFVFMVKPKNIKLIRKLTELNFTEIRRRGKFLEFSPPRILIFTGD
jgi:hypothetical protein